jgi:hypothetical protein
MQLVLLKKKYPMQLALEFEAKTFGVSELTAYLIPFKRVNSVLGYSRSLDFFVKECR